MMSEGFDELELYFDDTMVDQVEQEYNHKQIYSKYSRKKDEFQLNIL